MHRRKVLLAGGTALTTVLAGCGETESSDRQTGDTNNNEDNGDDDGGETGDAGDTEETLIELLNHEWYDDGEFSSGVKGQIENVSDKTLSYVEVKVYFLDSEGVQFSESLANTEDLASGRVWEFDAMFTGDDKSRVENYEIETTVNNY